jgi:hypothetical protein
MRVKKICLLSFLFLISSSLLYSQIIWKGSEFQVNTTKGGNQYQPKIAMNASGNFIAVWTSDEDGDHGGIYAQLFDYKGSIICSEFRVNESILKHQSRPSVSCDSIGNFVVTWTSEHIEENREDIYARRYDFQGNPLSGEFRVNTHTIYEQTYSDVDMNSVGQFVIVWMSWDQVGFWRKIFAQRYDTNGATVGTELQVNTEIDFENIYPSVAIDKDGNFIVTWQKTELGNFDIYAQLFDTSGNKINEAFCVNTYTTSGQYNPKIEMNSKGDFIITWCSNNQDGDDKGIYCQRYDSYGNPIGNEFRVNTTTIGSQIRQSADMDETGNFVICWVSEDEQQLGVFTQIYNFEGKPMGSEFQVNTTWNFDQDEPDIALNENGIFVIVWSSNPLGSPADIIGRQFKISPDSIPTAPKNLIATPGDQKVTLTWSQNPESDLSHYQIYRSRLHGFVPAITDTLAMVLYPDNSYIDTEVINGQTYYYRISAVNVAGNESDYSEEVSAKPQAGLSYPNIVVSALEHNFGDVPLLATASWQVTIDNQGTANLEVNNIVSDNPVFSANTRQFIIEPGSGHSVYIQFTPDSLQTERGAVTIISNDPDQPEFKITLSGKGIDNQAPEIILPTPTAKMWVSADYLLSAQIKDNWVVRSASLFYRNGAQRNFQSLGMSQGQGENYLGAIPGTEVTFAGIAYFIRAEDSAGNTTISDTVSQAIYFQDGVLSTSRIPCPYQAGYPRGEWHQISVPAMLDQSGASAVLNDETELGNYGEPNWRLFSYQDTNGDNITDGYMEFRSDLESSVFRFDSGNAFWLKANPDGAKIEIDVGAGHVLPLAPQVIGLKPGWNQIGNPFAFPISFSPNDQRIVNKLYLPDGSGGYQLTTTLQPWAGYFVFVNGNRVVDLKLAPLPGNPLNKTIADEAEWMFQINASCGESKDEINFLGISETSTDEWDSNDYPEPPAIGDFISLFFPHEDWQGSCKNFTSDFRNSVGEGQIWNLMITTNQKSSEVNLSWNQLIIAEENLQFQLYDCIRNVTVDMEKAREYRFSRLNQEINSPFQILVGSREFVERQVAEIQSRLPKDFCLFQNYPNPFNSTTQIRFQLPYAEKVSLKILNLMGREVRALVNEHRAAGNHQISWDGKDNQGTEAGTGVYLCVFQAGQYFESRKVLVLR